MSSRIATSGMLAAFVGLRTTANNIANAATTDFRPSRVDFAERVADGAGRGVQVSRIARQSNQHEVDLAEQLLEMIRFSQQIKAQAAVIRTETDNTDSIMGTISERDSG